tara:strand:- start:17678 stop:17908 length:231 start_codon:yes stop_codon:yes gene_type:complete
MTENKLIEIETTLAHHDQQLMEMSAVITDQWKEIETLKRKLSRAIDKIDQLGHDADDGGKALSGIEQAARDKPPHY